MKRCCLGFRKTNHNEWAAGIGNIYYVNAVGRYEFMFYGRNLRGQFKPDAV